MKHYISINIKRIIKSELLVKDKFSVKNSFSELGIEPLHLNFLYMILEGFFDVVIIDSELDGDITLIKLRNHISDQLQQIKVTQPN